MRSGCKKYLLTYAQFPSRPDQRLPFPVTDLAGKKHFHLAMEKIARSRITRAHRLGVQPRASPKEPGGKNAAVVDHQKIATAEQVRQVGKFPIFKFTTFNLIGLAKKMEHARSATVGQRLLGNQFFIQMEIKVGNQHGCNYIGW